MEPKNELENPPFWREPTEMNNERQLLKGNAELNMREDTHICSPGYVIKGKASGACRTCSSAAGNLSSGNGGLRATLEREYVTKAHSVAGVNNCKRLLPTHQPLWVSGWVRNPKKNPLIEAMLYL